MSIHQYRTVSVVLLIVLLGISGAATAEPDSPRLTAAARTAAGELPAADDAAVIAVGDCDVYRYELDFGPVAVGGRASLVNWIYNNGTTDIVIDVTSDDPDVTLDVPNPVIPAGGRVLCMTHYRPSSASPLDAVISLGDAACPTIHVTGAGLAATADGPNRLGLYFDSYLSSSVREANPGFPVATAFLVLSDPGTPGGVRGWECRVEIDGPASLIGWDLYGSTVNVGMAPDFIVGVGEPLPQADDVTLATLQFLSTAFDDTARISLVPPQVASVDGQMTWLSHNDIGVLLEMVQAEGSGPAAIITPTSGSACYLFREEIDFGPMAVGSRGHYNNFVQNYSAAPITIAPTCDHPDVTVTATRAVLQPGERSYLDIFYQPSSVGQMFTEIRLGSEACNAIPLAGSGFTGHPDGPDQIGVYWDQEYTATNLVLDGSSPVAVGHLVLKNASSSGGLAAWECRVDVVGSALLTGSSIPYQNINIGTAPDFIVAPPAPIPFDEHVVLATLFFSTPDPFGATLISLGPTSVPSIAGQMGWIAGRDNDNIIDMVPATGMPLVATINGEAPVAIALPTPLAAATGQAVELSWTAPAGDWDGFHVYGRTVVGQAERLTETPLTAFGGTVRFHDDLGRYAPGARVFYSYAAVKSGAEFGRSPEVEFQVPEVPLVATRLLPNVPNPFNPQTEIRFELGKAQRVDLRIYDVTGRLVRTLVDRELAHGPHAEVWRGRDNAGRPVPSGAYYVRLLTGEGAENRKIMLLK